MKKEQVGLIVALGLVVWLLTALVRVENERYALQLGMCRDKIGLTDFKCLSAVQTRTGWYWHLFYALKD
jgi:hypothetical protein